MDFFHSNGQSPSGVSVPSILLQRLKQQQADASSALESSHAVLPQSTIPGALSEASSVEDQLLRRTSQALMEIQKQIQRGEETYYEETQAYYNSSLFRGFDTIIDARAINLNSHSNGMPGGGNSNNSQSGPRRMPADFRWFSSSFTSIPRHGNTKSASIAASRASQPLTSTGVVSTATSQAQGRSSGVGMVKKNAAAAAAAAATLVSGGHSGPRPPPPSSSLPSVEPSNSGGNRGTKRCTSAPPVVGQKRPCLDTATSKTATSRATVDNRTISSSSVTTAAAASPAPAPSSKDRTVGGDASTSAAVKREGGGEGTTAAVPAAATSASTAAPSAGNKTGEVKSGSSTKGRPPGKSESGKRRTKRKRTTGT